MLFNPFKLTSCALFLMYREVIPPVTEDRPDKSVRPVLSMVIVLTFMLGALKLLKLGKSEMIKEPLELNPKFAS